MVHIKLQALLVCSFTGRKILETKSQKVLDTNKELYILLLPTTFTHFFELIAHTRFGPNWAIFSDVMLLTQKSV
jgi:hypothetical protein